MAVLAGHDDAPADAAIGIERRTDVAFQPDLAPGTQRQAGRGGELLAGTLVQHVDGGRRVAIAADQARGAAHDFDAVVDGRVEQRIGARIDGHAIDLVIADGKAARRKVRAFAVVFLHRHARRLHQHLGQAVQAHVVHALARHDRDRLRRFANRQAHARGRGHLLCRVGTRMLGRCLVLLAHYFDLAQGGFIGLGRRLGSQGRAGAQRCRQQCGMYGDGQRTQGNVGNRWGKRAGSDTGQRTCSRHETSFFSCAHRRAAGVVGMGGLLGGGAWLAQSVIQPRISQATVCRLRWES